jgi:hypothetical protein
MTSRAARARCRSVPRRRRMFVGTSLRGASAPKQSRLSPRRRSGLLRFARNDVDLRSMHPHSRGTMCPSFARHHPPKSKRAQGMPGEGLTHGPPAKEKAGGRYHRCSRSSGIPCAMAYDLFRALPGDRAFLPPSPADRSARLASASGGQDHTTSSSALAPFARTILVRVAKASTASPPHVS